MTCLQCQLMQWMDADEREMGKAQCFHRTLISGKKKKKEELGAVHQQDLSLMEKVIIASNFHSRRTCVLQIASVSFRMAAADAVVTFILFTLEWVCDA